MPKPQPQPVTKTSHVKDLILLFSVPAVVVLLAFFAVAVPRMFAKPTYDFIYAYCEDYACAGSYSMDGTGSITYTPNSDNGYSYTKPVQLAYFEANTGASRSLDKATAQSYSLINSSRSPDGYTLTWNYASGGGLFFGDSGDSGWQLANGAKKKTIRLNGADQYSSSNTTFLGWVQK